MQGADHRAQRGSCVVSGGPGKIFSNLKLRVQLALRDPCRSTVDVDLLRHVVLLLELVHSLLDLLLRSLKSSLDIFLAFPAGQVGVAR